MNVSTNLLLVGIAGATGALLRVGCNAVSDRFIGTDFPWSTLAVNLVGSFAFGAVYGLARSRTVSAELEGIVLAGLLGGFTTYSAFAFQSTTMLASGRTVAAVTYILATNLLGLLAVQAGLSLGR